MGNCRDFEYLEQCRKEGGEYLSIIPSLPYKSEIVRSALKGASFYVEVGFEPPGLSAIEAGLAGCRLLLSDSSWSREYFGDLAVYVDPSDISSIENGMEEVLKLEKNSQTLTSSLHKYCLPESLDPFLHILRKVVS